MKEITLQIPDKEFKVISEVAEIKNRNIQDVVLNSLRSSVEVYEDSTLEEIRHTRFRDEKGRKVCGC